jgi:hypothetical protein
MNDKILLISDGNDFNLKELTKTINKLYNNKKRPDKKNEIIFDLELCELRDFIKSLNKVFIDVQIKNKGTSLFQDNEKIFV